MSSDIPALEDAYELGEEIGRGAVGVVLQGRDRASGEPVAIKLPLRELDEEGRERILREARLLQSLDQPGMTKLHGCFRTQGGSLALVYEYVRGKPLIERIGKSGVAPERALAWATSLGEALDALHRAGFVHRDLKPANVLVNPKGEVKLCDLGLVKPVAEGHTITRTGEIYGTPYYMAPEVLQGARPGPAADRYAFACMVYEMLAGQPPFMGDQLEVVSGHINQPPPPVTPFGDGRDRRVQLVFGRMLAKHPEDRYPFAGEATDALDEAYRSDPGAQPRSADATEEITAMRSSLVSRERRPKRKAEETPSKEAAAATGRRGGLWAGAAFLLVAGLAALRPGSEPLPPPPPTAAPSPAAPVGGPVGPDPVSRVHAELDAMPASRRDPDSRRMSELLEGLPLVADWRRWLVAGAKVGELSSDERRTLAAADEVFIGKGLLSPFRPWLVVPSPVCPIDEADWLEMLDERRLSDEPVPLAGPWLCLAAASARVAAARGRQLEKELKANPEGPYPGGIDWPSGSLIFRFKTPTLDAFLAESLRVDSVNVAAWRWTRPAIREVRTFLAAGWRSLREEASTRQLTAYFMNLWIHESRAILSGPLARFPPDLLLGDAPRDPFEAYVLGSVLYNQNQIHGRVLPVDERWSRRELEAWRQAETVQGREPFTRRMRLRARQGQLHALIDLKDLEGLAGLFLRYREGAGEIAERMEVHLVLDLAREGFENPELLRLSPEDGRWLLARTRALADLPEAVLGEEDGRRITETSERLAKAIGVGP